MRIAALLELLGYLTLGGLFSLVPGYGQSNKLAHTPGSAATLTHTLNPSRGSDKAPITILVFGVNPKTETAS
jgi:hypothetical protein